MDEKKKGKTCAILVRSIPEDLRNEFKASCAREGKTMNEKILALLENVVQEDRAELERVIEKLTK